MARQGNGPQCPRGLSANSPLPSGQRSLRSRNMAEKTMVCRVDEVAPDAAHIVKVRNLSIGVFRVGESVHAMLNVCPHRGAPLCEGPQCGTTATVNGTDFIYCRD